MERKYKQRGYMDSGRERQEKPRQEPRPKGAKEFRPRQMPGFHEAARCSMCGASIALEIELNTQCPKCKTDLHVCKQCGFFDSAARFECLQPIPERVQPKNVRNQCTFFSAKKSIERETTSQSSRPAVPKTAREAFDALFKK
ncbi:MAG: hypothetical protein FJW26_09785 [Acidimicrobiia bacterium]|nr:hypothetical protein [Acidimicrobiia bacterium]